MTTMPYADAFLAEEPDQAVADLLQVLFQFVCSWDV